MRYVWDKKKQTWVEADSENSPSPNAVGQVGWPIVSDALAVHHDQVPEAIADAKKRGVPTEFRRDGRPILRDRSHRKAYLKAYEMHDRNSFTGY